MAQTLEQKQDLETESRKILDNFYESIRSAHTKITYRSNLEIYVNYIGLAEFLNQKDPRIIESQIIKFIIELKKRHKAYSTVHNYVTAIFSFYRMNDIILNTRKVSRYLPEQRKVKKDREYEYDEISKLLQIADERMRVVILLLASTGMRIGALTTLRLSHLEKLNEDNSIYKIIVYENYNEEYITFCTPECTAAIDSYLDMRSRCGEKIDKRSFLLREHFDVRDIVSDKPVQIRPQALTRKLIRFAQRTGIRKVEYVEERATASSLRKDVMIAHGFRKFFTKRLIHAKVNPEIREMLLGHKIGLTSCYYKPTDEEMFEEYQKVIDDLTIDPANRLQRKVEKLEVDRLEYEALAADIARIKKKVKID